MKDQSVSRLMLLCRRSVHRRGRRGVGSTTKGANRGQPAGIDQNRFRSAKPNRVVYSQIKMLKPAQVREFRTDQCADFISREIRALTVQE